MSGLRSLVREAQREARKGQERQRQLENRAIRAAVAARQRKQAARHEGYAADIIRQREANKPHDAKLKLEEKLARWQMPLETMKAQAALEGARARQDLGYGSVRRKKYDEQGAVIGEEVGTQDKNTGQIQWGGGNGYAPQPTATPQPAQSWKRFVPAQPQGGGIPMTIGGKPTAPIQPSGVFSPDMLPNSKPITPKAIITSKKKPEVGGW